MKVNQLFASVFGDTHTGDTCGMEMHLLGLKNTNVDMAYHLESKELMFVHSWFGVLNHLTVKPQSSSLAN